MKRSVVLSFAGLALAAGVYAHEGHKHEEAAAAKPEAPKADSAAPTPDAEVLTVIASYRAAMEARSVDELQEVVHPDLLVLEGVHKNVGWPDYRDNHIGPEMRDWKSFKVKDPKTLGLLVEGGLAYVVEESTFEIVMADKSVTLSGAETFVLTKEPAGWRIRHLHLSAKKRGS